jgi:hypothetical protein
MLDEDARAGRGVEPCDEASLFRGAKGRAGYAAGCGVEDMAAKAPGWWSGSSPEAAKRCASWRGALRATTVPVKMNVGVTGRGIRYLDEKGA